ncbi:MAG: ABC transporter ATP-binding protein [Kofleriaceae bacterium]|nr:ABC transporter ATP-binding protein [Kofleriaceae bacterium]MBP6841579.1 ABC transporter ATP-binding protein [Kofleriaceae bacterium]
MDDGLLLDDVTVALGDRVVVDAVRAEVRRGELVVVVGPNGAGKTTLLRALAGLVPRRGGRVLVDGVDPATAPRRALARTLAFLPQRVHMAFGFAVEDVVRMGRTAHRRGPGLDDADDVAAARAAMARVGVEALAGRRFDRLSGGEQRRVLLAQVLCQGARWLLFDEPTAALDPAHARAVFADLRATVDAGGHGAVVVSHDLNLAARFSTTMWLLDRGRLVARGPAAEVVAAPELAAAFGVELHVGRLDGGAPFVVPR